MSVTTMPDTSGVMMRRVYFSILLITISTTDPTMQAPNTAGRPPAIPAAIMGPMNEKLVPWMQSSPAPTQPIRRHWIKVDNPDAKSAIETRKPVVGTSSLMALAMISGGVTMATKMAKRCCKAAKNASRMGGLSCRP